MEIIPYNVDAPCIKECRNPSLKERLEIQKSELEGRLKRVNEALDALNQNPEVLKVLELVSRV